MDDFSKITGKALENGETIESAIRMAVVEPQKRKTEVLSSIILKLTRPAWSVWTEL